MIRKLNVFFVCSIMIIGAGSLLFSCKAKYNKNLIGIPETLKIFCEHPDKYVNKEIEINGAFLGWQGSGCNYVTGFAHQIMRSDWTFRDLDANCIYVTGGKPDFLDPLRNEDTGKRIKLKARFMKNKENKFYLEYISATEAIENN